MNENCTERLQLWCPVHGDCQCRDKACLCDLECPLHSIISDHGTFPRKDTESDTPFLVELVESEVAKP